MIEMTVLYSGSTSSTGGQGGDGDGVMEAGPVNHGAGPWCRHAADDGGEGVVASHILGHAVHSGPQVVLRVAVDVALHLHTRIERHMLCISYCVCHQCGCENE